MKRAFVVAAIVLAVAAVPQMSAAQVPVAVPIWPGDNWISMPLAPVDPDPAAVFDQIPIEGELRRFDRATQTEIVYTWLNRAQFGDIRVGEGYKLWFGDPPPYGGPPTFINYMGWPDNPDVDYTLPLAPRQGPEEPGITWIGHPLNGLVLFDDLLVTDGNEVVDILTAIEQRFWVPENMFFFDALVQSVMTVGPTPYVWLDDFWLRPNKMYWVQSYSYASGVALIVPGSGIGNLKTRLIGAPVKLSSKACTASLPPDVFYVEDDNRVSGIRVEWPGHGVAQGNRVTVQTGTVAVNANGERYVSNPTGGWDTSAVTLPPLGMNQRTLAQPNVTGLLVTIWGKTSGTQANYFYVDDGSGLTSFTSNKGVKVYYTNPPANDLWRQVTGVKSLEIPPGGTDPEPVVLTRVPGDVR